MAQEVSVPYRCSCEKGSDLMWPEPAALPSRHGVQGVSPECTQSATEKRQTGTTCA